VEGGERRRKKKGRRALSPRLERGSDALPPTRKKGGERDEGEGIEHMRSKVPAAGREGGNGRLMPLGEEEEEGDLSY